ncbi:MAG: F0F1 ATP synthase subunit A, partial [Deltaproteobacteria bacterium]|nr:F0F1 ATP synthase subunit A [Deltaproteobacteria bacterium]
MGHHPFTWYDLVPAFLQGWVPLQIFFSVVSMVLLVCLAVAARRRLLDTHNAVIPSDRITLVNIFELLIEFVTNLSDSIIGHHGRRYLSLYGTFFIFILLSNFIGLVPGFSPPTSNLNITLGMGLVSFGAYHY